MDEPNIGSIRRAKILVIFIAVLNILVVVVVFVLYLYALFLVAGLSDRGAPKSFYLFTYLIPFLVACFTSFLFWKIMRLKNLARVIWLFLLVLLSIWLSVYWILEGYSIYIYPEIMIIFFVLLLNLYFFGLKKNIIELFSHMDKK